MVNIIRLLFIFFILLTPAIFSEELLDITADSVVVDNKTNQITYSGNVKIVYGFNKILANKVVIKQLEKLGNQMIATSTEKSPVIYQNTGKNLITVSATKAVYLSENKTITFNGKVVAKTEDTRLEGDYLIYNVVHHKLITRSKKNKKVSTLIKF